MFRVLNRLNLIYVFENLLPSFNPAEEDTREKGKLYKPQSRLTELADKLSTAERAQEYARLLGDRKPDRPGKKRDREKKKSNLELFKEELKL
jgi:U2-associated protein SR140